MCLLMVTIGQLPDREYLENACLCNPDGFGFAVNHGDRIVTGRSMKHERLIERFYDEMGRSENPVGMFHARYTTHGTTTLENNHPFRVDGRKDIVLAHNGMLPIEPRKGDNRSDTRIFAEDILGSIGVEQLDDKHVFNSLEYFAQGSKIAILSTAPELRDKVYILNEHLGHWQGDIWWSNSSYKYPPIYSPSKSSYYRSYSSDYQAWGDEHTVIGSSPSQEYFDELNESYFCEVCASIIPQEEMMYNVCKNCNSCFDCWMDFNECMCYNPIAKNDSALLRMSDYYDYDYSTL